MRRRLLLVLGLVAAALAAAVTIPPLFARQGSAQSGQAGEPARSMESRLREAEALARVKRAILDSYVEDVDEKKLFYGSLRGMLRELDPHSTFLTPQEYQDMTAATTGKFGGLGIEITLKDGWLTVVTPLMGTPAFKAGVLPGDRIVKIDGAETDAMALEEAVHKMRGKPGTKVLLAIARKGEGRVLDIEIVRQIIRVESVRIPQILDPGEKIGYVSLTSFQEDTAEELEKALARLEGEGLRALVLDLRVNGGGRMDAAIKVANLFLDKGVIVSVKGRPGPNQHSEVYQATKAGTRPEYPLALLVNQSSASASEIVAGALRDHHRAVLVGERTFGKGSVQTLRDLKIGSETAGLKLTTAYYYTPSGQCIHKIGIEPDVKVPLDVEVLAEVMRRQHDKWVEQNAPKNGAEKPGEKPAEKPAPAPEKPAPPAAERTWDKPAPEGEGAPADGKAARDKGRLVDLQLEAALTALRAMLVDRERGAPVRKYLPPEEKGSAAAAKTPAPPVPEPEPEPAPVE